MKRSQRAAFRFFGALLCAACIAAQSAETNTAQGAAQPAAKISPEQLDSLVAPIALYPDPLLAQTLAASTYPLEIIQLQQWLAKNPKLKDKALADAVAKQPWDPSIQAMAALPDVVKRLADDIQWTTDLGNAFLAQQGDVMDAVQRMRKKAVDGGNLKTTEQQKVETKVVEEKTVIVVEQADPQIVYVPTYNPTVVYGPPVYPYPPIYYPPPPPPGAFAMSFTVGVFMGAAFSGGWGWGPSWGHSSVYVNVNNSFNRPPPPGGPGGAGGPGANWQHNPAHRGGTPYPNRTTTDRYGGAARGDSAAANRQTQARQQISSQGGNVSGPRAGGSGGISDRAGGAGDFSARTDGGPDFSGGGAGGINQRTGGSGADRIGSQDLSRGGGAGRDAFDGGGGGFDGSHARASSSRGASSMGARGGGSRGGGGRGGGRR